MCVQVWVRLVWVQNGGAPRSPVKRGTPGPREDRRGVRAPLLYPACSSSARGGHWFPNKRPRCHTESWVSSFEVSEKPGATLR